MLRAGKALNERSVVVRMQLHENPVPLFGPHGTHQNMRNEFVMRLQPGEQQAGFMISEGRRVKALHFTGSVKS